MPTKIISFNEECNTSIMLGQLVAHLAISPKEGWDKYLGEIHHPPSGRLEWRANCYKMRVGPIEQWWRSRIREKSHKLVLFKGVSKLFSTGRENINTHPFTQFSICYSWSFLSTLASEARSPRVGPLHPSLNN